MSDDVVALVPTKSDAEVAADLKKRFEDAMLPALAIMDEAVAKRLVIRFQSIVMMPPYMRHQLVQLEIIKIY